MNRRAAVLAAAISAAACGGPPVQPWSPAPEAGPRWSSTLSAWTRRGEAYEAFEGRLFATATCLSPALTNGWLRERATREGWSPTRLESELATATERGRTTLGVIVGVTAQDARWNDAAPGGTLEMTLTVDGIERPARLSRKLSDDELGDLVPYFTWVTPLHTGYLIEFDAPSAPASLALRVAGPPARVEMRWDLPR
jgi:hypothetical protein